jgi:hypothetical protein
MNGATLSTQILRLLTVRKKLQTGDYLTTREEDDVSQILGVPKFKNKEEMGAKIDAFFTWISDVLVKKNPS